MVPWPVDESGSGCESGRVVSGGTQLWVEGPAWRGRAAGAEGTGGSQGAGQANQGSRTLCHGPGGRASLSPVSRALREVRILTWRLGLARLSSPRSQVQPLRPPPAGPQVPWRGCCPAVSGLQGGPCGVWAALPVRLGPGGGWLFMLMQPRSPPPRRLCGPAAWLPGVGVAGEPNSGPEWRPGAGPHVPSACCRPAFAGCPGKLLRSTCSPAAGVLTTWEPQAIGSDSRTHARKNTEGDCAALGNNTTLPPVPGDTHRGLRAPTVLRFGMHGTHPLGLWDAGTGGAGRYSPGAE